MLGIKTGLDITSVNKTKQEFTKLLTDLQNTANRNPIRINITNTTSQINSINNSMRDLGNSANNTSNSFKGLGSSLGSLTGFYARWLSVSSAVNLALSETRKAIGFAFEQDERVRNVSMISGEDRKTVQGYTQDWLNLGLELKQSTSIISESNEEWLRAGANISEINELTKMTVKTSEIAGSAIKDTTSQAIALKNAYSMTNRELEGVLESVVKMDNTSSTGTDKLLRSLLVVAPSAKQAKAPIEWLVAGLTTVQSKSKQTAESVGKNFRNIFLNITKMTNGEDQIGLNKAEDQLNKINIAMRSNATTFRSADKILDDLGKTWNTLSEIQQAELSMSLAGKENSNSFNILMQNQAETLKNLNNIKSAGGSLDKAYEEHLISAKGALGELKASLEQLYAQMISGDGLKNVLNDLTKIVNFVGFLITDGKELTKVWIGLLIAVKNFKLLEVGIMGCVTAFKYLHVFGLESLTLLSFNPIVLSVVALVAILATVTYSQYKHSKQVKELRQEYDLLNKSMGEMDGKGIKENIDKLKEQQKELDKLAKSAGYKRDMGFGVTDDSGQRNLDKFIKTLEEGGYTVDKTKNKIVELYQAESNIATSDSITAIQDKTNATIEEATETQNLISQYMSLSQQENLSGEKKKILSNLTQQLVGRVDGLTVATDTQGNSSITNSKHLSGQIDVLELLKQSSILTANALIEGAINSSSAIHNGTIQTLEDMKATIIAQQTLSQALANTKTGKSGFFDTEQTAIGMGIKNLEASVAKIESLKNKFNMKAPALSGITSGNPSGYTPSSTDGKDKADKQDIANLETKADRYYKLESALQNVEIELDRLNKLESNATESEKLKLKEKEIKLLGDKKIALQSIYKELGKENQLNADNLKKLGAKFDSNGNISNKNELVLGKTSNANKLTGDAKKTAIDSVKKFEDDIKSYEDIRFNKIVDISSKIFNLEQDIVSKTIDKWNIQFDAWKNIWDKRIDVAGDIQDKIDLLEINDPTNTGEKLKLTNELIKQEELVRQGYLDANVGLTKRLSTLNEETLEWQTINNQIEIYNENIDDSDKKLANLNKTLKDVEKNNLDVVKNAQEKIKEAIKKRYEEEQKLAKETVEKNKAQRDKEHKDIIDKLNGEKKAYDDFYKLKLQNLDRESSEKDYSDKVNDLIKDKMKLQKEYDSLLMDNSLGAKARREDIKDQLSKVQESIDGEQFNRNIELQKNNINDLADAQKNVVDAKIDRENDLYEQKKEQYENELKQIDKKYEKLLKEENLYRESTTALINNQYVTEEGHIITLTSLITKFTDEWGDGLSAVGDKIKSEIIDNLSKAQDVLGTKSNISNDGMAEKIKAMSSGSVYFDGNIVDLNTINSKEGLEKYQALISKAKSVYIKDYQGIVHNNRTGKVESFSEGGVIDYTGSANVHGSPNNAEVVFNSKQALALHNFVTRLSSESLSSNNLPISKIPRLSQDTTTTNNMSEVTLSIANLVNIEGNVDKNTLPDIEDISKKVLTRVQKEFNKHGYFKKV